MATIILRPTSATGSSWTNISNAYDESITTSATVAVTSNNYTSRTGTFNFDISSIPSGAIINSATLTVNCKSNSTRLTLYADINGNSSNRVISATLNTTQSNRTASITRYMSTLNNILLTIRNSRTTSYTFTLYEIYITVDYTLNYTVTFKDWNGTVLKTETVESGNSATAPTTNPSRDGYNFVGWDNTFNNVTSDIVVTAQYEAIQPPKTQKRNIIIDNKAIGKIFIGDNTIFKVFLGDIKLFDAN